jgi:hypothetical protein
MPTLGETIRRILNETRRDESTEGSNVQDCILDAIQHYEMQRLHFNQDRSETFSTVASQQYYGSAALTSIPNILEFDNVAITIASSDVRNLKKVPWETLQEWNPDAAVTGQPSHYAYYAQEIRLYPIPNNVWTVTISGLFQLAVPSLSTDTGPWLTRGQGYNLIKYHAKSLFCADYIDDDSGAQKAAARAQFELDALQRSLGRRQGTGEIEGSL